MNTHIYRVVLLSALTTLAIAGCGSSSGSGGGTTQNPTATPSTSAGDIADTANYLTFHGTGFRVKYVEGWGINVKPAGVVISDKDSSETVAITANAQGQAVSAIATTDLAHQRTAAPRFQLITTHGVQLPSGASVYAQYRTLSPKDPVTGKQVPVVVDRYYVPGTGRYAIVTLATPLGVDNVDAFKLIARSFIWR